MNQLTITNADGKTLIHIAIGEIDPPTATVAILSALQCIKPKRRERSDKGKLRDTVGNEAAGYLAKHTKPGQ